MGSLSAQSPAALREGLQVFQVFVGTRLRGPGHQPRAELPQCVLSRRFAFASADKVADEILEVFAHGLIVHGCFAAPISMAGGCLVNTTATQHNGARATMKV